MRYFKKSFPKQQVLIDPDSKLWLQFTTVDYSTGIYATNDERILKCIDRTMAEQRGGMTEITGDEYKGLSEKKNSTTPKPPWREEFSKGMTPTPVPQLAIAGGREDVVAAEVGSIQPSFPTGRPTASKR